MLQYNIMANETLRMRTRSYANVISCLFVFLFVWFSVLPVRAQEATGLKVQPAIIEERVDPGQVFSSTLSAANLGSDTKTFYIIKRDISGISPTGAPIFAGEEEKTGFEVSSWIKVSQESITIAPGQTKKIPFSVEIPKDASSGGHFGGIFLSLAPERPEETGIGIGYQVGTIISLQISGEIFEEAQIREFRTNRMIYSRPEVTFITRVENNGNVLVRPRGPLEITDFFEKKVATLRINDAGAAVLPKTTRQFETSWQGEGLAFGRYQAVMSLVYGQDERKTISRTLSFWILPLNIILPVAGGIFGLILLVFILVRLHIRRKLREIRKATENIVSRNSSGTDKREFLHHQKGAPFSRLALMTIAMLIFTLLFLIVLFFFFA